MMSGKSLFVYVASSHLQRGSQALSLARVRVLGLEVERLVLVSVTLSSASARTVLCRRCLSPQGCDVVLRRICTERRRLLARRVHVEGRIVVLPLEVTL